MNAKKIMGAVLVALLAAALFVGAGAAAGEVKDIGVVYTYVDLTGDGFEKGQTFTAEDGSAPIMTQKFIDASGKFGFPVENPSTGYYTNGTVKFKLVPATAVISVINADGKSVVGGEAEGTLTVAAGIDKMIAASVDLTKLVFITPDQAVVTAFDGWTAATGKLDTTKMASGKWGVKLDLSGIVVKGGPKYTEPVYFTVVSKDAADAAITVDKDTVLVSNVILVTINKDGEINYNAEYLKPVENQVGMKADNKFDKGTYAFEALKKGETTLKLIVTDDSAEVDVTIENGVITAVAEDSAFFVGNPIKLSGTTTAGGKDLYFWIEGTNFGFKQFESAEVQNFKLKDGKWSVELASSVQNGEKTLTAGSSYTIYVTNDNTNFADKKALMEKTYTTVSVSMKQPFITDVVAPATAIQGTDLEITGIAEAADNVKIYLFGINYFNAKEVSIAKKANGKFEFTMPVTSDMAPGTYFYLIQHPMKDAKFNVWNGTQKTNDVDATVAGTVKEGDFYYAATGAANATYLFNAWTLGTNYAAQALMNQISGQNIDDIFVQGTFKVDVPKLTIDSIPSEITAGTNLVVSGTTNAADGANVIVNVYAGTFGASEKGSINENAFLSEKAKTQKDGTWTVTLETSKLTAGEYTAAVYLNGDLFDSEDIKVVDKPDTPVTPDTPDTPVTPEQPEQPVAPATPGFGALAALAGLGAVA